MLKVNVICLFTCLRKLYCNYNNVLPLQWRIQTWRSGEKPQIGVTKIHWEFERFYDNAEAKCYIHNLLNVHTKAFDDLNTHP